MKDYHTLYVVETAKLDAIALEVFTHRKHLCENLNDYSEDIKERVCKIMRVQLDLLIKINRQTPLPAYPKGPF